MPKQLKQILADVEAFQGSNGERKKTTREWLRHVERIRREVPSARVEDDGETIRLGDLSPGCVACKTGRWDCIFVTTGCNLECPFCLRPEDVSTTRTGSVFGTTPTDIARNYGKTHISGISFSGGEPFMNVPKLLEWVTGFTTRYPDKYYWIYTNGLLARETDLRRLGELGIDEIRFNTAATGYDHPSVVESLAAAARCIPTVTVEIPAIPEHAAKVLRSLACWCRAGVKFLNMHELIYESGTSSATFPGDRRVFVMPDGHRCDFNPKSRALTLAVMKKIHKDGLRLAVNHCSMHSKIRQLHGRQRSMAPLVKSVHERLADDQSLESCCAYRGEETLFFHPDLLDEMRRRCGEYQFVQLKRTVPLSLDSPGRWITFEKIMRDEETPISATPRIRTNSGF